MTGLLNVMQKDMHIYPYRDEQSDLYTCRIIYSALSHWIRCAILDNSEEKKYKSKSYILNRGITQLKGFLEYFPNCHKWFITDESEIKDSVIAIRERMINSGELVIDCDNLGLWLPSQNIMDCFSGIDRVVGINSYDGCYFTGLTRIKRNKKSIGKEYLKSIINLDEYLRFFYESDNWVECSDIEKYEMFNPLSKDAPYKSWIKTPIKSIKYHIGRLSLYNDYHEYYLFKFENGKWYNYKFNSEMIEGNEERRIILGLRKKYNNQIKVKYEHFDSVVLIHLKCRMPIFEESIIETYSWPLNNIEDKLNYVIPVIIWDNLKCILEQNLGMIVEGD